MFEENQKIDEKDRKMKELQEMIKQKDQKIECQKGNDEKREMEEFKDILMKKKEEEREQKI